MKNVVSRAALAAVGCAGVAVGGALTPVNARMQSIGEPVERPMLLVIASSKPRELSKVHWGVYQLAEYSYTSAGKQTVTPKNVLIAEEDMGVGQGFNRAGLKLKSGEYEIHLQPEKSRPIVQKFLVNNLATTAVGLNFTVAPIEDDDERKKTEVIRIGPSLGDLESRIATLERKAGIAPSKP